MGADGRTYSYDFENRIVQVTGPNLSISITYNGDGDRVEKTVNGVTTKYLVDRNNLTGYAQVVEEIQNNQVIRQYTYGLDLISERQLINGSYQVSFYGYDGHGSVRYLTDANGNVTDTYDYDAFGVLINQTGSTPNNYLYAGEQYDADLGLYYNRARYLNVNDGRFFSIDSYEGQKSDPTSIHKYTYCTNNPLNNIDPSGHLSVGEAIITLVIIGIVTSISTSCRATPSNKRARTISLNLESLPQDKWLYNIDLFNPDKITPAEQEIIKQEMVDTLQKALKDWQVTIVRGGNINNQHNIDLEYAFYGGDPIGVGTTGYTPPNSKQSYVYLRAEAYHAKQTAPLAGKTNRSDIITGIGHGLGYSAAHEFWHQIGLEADKPTRHSQNPNDITLGSIPDSIQPGVKVEFPPNMFFGEQTWPKDAHDLLDASIPSSK